MVFIEAFEYEDPAQLNKGVGRFLLASSCGDNWQKGGCGRVTGLPGDSWHQAHSPAQHPRVPRLAGHGGLAADTTALTSSQRTRQPGTRPLLLANSLPAQTTSLQQHKHPSNGICDRTRLV